MRGSSVGLLFGAFALVNSASAQVECSLIPIPNLGWEKIYPLERTIKEAIQYNSGLERIVMKPEQKLVHLHIIGRDWRRGDFKCTTETLFECFATDTHEYRGKQEWTVKVWQSFVTVTVADELVEPDSLLFLLHDCQEQKDD